MLRRIKHLATLAGFPIVILIVSLLLAIATYAAFIQVVYVVKYDTQAVENYFASHEACVGLFNTSPSPLAEMTGFTPNVQAKIGVNGWIIAQGSASQGEIDGTPLPQPTSATMINLTLTTPDRRAVAVAEVPTGSYSSWAQVCITYQRGHVTKVFGTAHIDNGTGKFSLLIGRQSLSTTNPSFPFIWAKPHNLPFKGTTVMAKLTDSHGKSLAFATLNLM